MWPALHALPPGDHRSFPETIDTATVYTGGGSHNCTLDITHGVTYGLGSLIKLPVISPIVQGDKSAFFEYMRDKDINKYSYFDGCQPTFNFRLGNKTLLWNKHLGGYDGILRGLEPKYDVVIFVIAGIANHSGRPWDGSVAEYVREMVGCLGEPGKVIWCLHDKRAINPKFIDTRKATEVMESETKSKVVDLEPARVFKLFS